MNFLKKKNYAEKLYVFEKEPQRKNQFEMFIRILLLLFLSASACRVWPERTYEVEEEDTVWHVHLTSTHEDSFDHIPNVSWSGHWAESMPAHTLFSVRPEHGPDAIDAIEKMGYVSERHTLDCSD